MFCWYHFFLKTRIQQSNLVLATWLVHAWIPSYLRSWGRRRENLRTIQAAKWMLSQNLKVQGYSSRVEHLPNMYVWDPSCTPQPGKQKYKRFCFFPVSGFQNLEGTIKTTTLEIVGCKERVMSSFSGYCLGFILSVMERKDQKGRFAQEHQVTKLRVNPRLFSPSARSSFQGKGLALRFRGTSSIDTFNVALSL